MSRLGVPGKEAGPPAAFWAWCLTVGSGTGVSSRGRCQLLPLYSFSDTSLTAWAGSTLLNVFEKAYSLCSSGPDWMVLCREC